MLGGVEMSSEDEPELRRLIKRAAIWARDHRAEVIEVVRWLADLSLALGSSIYAGLIWALISSTVDHMPLMIALLLSTALIAWSGLNRSWAR